MKRPSLLIAVLALAQVSYAVPSSAQQVPIKPLVITASFPGVAGMVVEPGQEVVVNWTLKGSGVKFYETHTWGECELLLSVDEGDNWTRITPQLAVARRNFTWIVPDTPTPSARLGLQIGLAGDGEMYHFASDEFTIVDTGGAPGVRFAGVKAGEAVAGSAIELSWTSTVFDAVRHEVLVSSDLGAHFFSVGSTQGRRLPYIIPKDYEGFLTVQVVAHREGAAPIRSDLGRASTFRVRNAGS